MLLQIKTRLQEAGLPFATRDWRGRPAVLRPGKLTGLTTAVGSTGFSVRPEPDSLLFNVVVSGREAGVAYRPVQKARREASVTVATPVNPEVLYPKIAKVFEDLDFGVRQVRKTPVNLFWEEDIDYAITTDPLPSHPSREHDLITEMVDLASSEPGGYGGVGELEKLHTSGAIYFALRAVPACVLAEHLDATRVEQLIRRSRKGGLPGEHEHWLAVRNAQVGPGRPAGGRGRLPLPRLS